MTSGVDERHDLIVESLLRSLEDHLVPTCRAYSSDMSVGTAEPTRSFNPDATVACGRSELDNDVLLDPVVIFEVLSDSTEHDDRSRKFHAYLRIESLRHYVLIWGDDYVAEQYRRDGHQWFYSNAKGLDGILRLPAVNCELPLREIYRQVLESLTTNLHGGPP